MASPFFWGIMFFSTPYSPSCLDTWKFFREKIFFHKICCHSATNLPKPLCFRHMPVVAARWQVAVKPHPQPLPEREGSGCAQGVTAG